MLIIYTKKMVVVTVKDTDFFFNQPEEVLRLRFLRNRLKKFILLLSNFENHRTVPLDKVVVQFSSKLTACCVSLGRH